MGEERSVLEQVVTLEQRLEVVEGEREALLRERARLQAELAEARRLNGAGTGGE